MKATFDTREAALAATSKLDQLIRERFDSEKIPEFMKSRDQWIVWRWDFRNNVDGEIISTKLPLQINGKRASSTDPETWSSYDEAYEAYQNNTQYAGVGYIISKDDGIVGIDFDNCLQVSEDGVPTFNTDILGLIESYNSYTEASPSQTGLKMLGLGEIPKSVLNSGAGSGFKVNNYLEDIDIEVYQHSRFFTITSRKLTVKPNELDSIQGLIESIASSKTDGDPNSQLDFSDDDSSVDQEVVEDLQQAVDTHTQKANISIIDRIRNSVQADIFNALYSGNISKYPSHSEADLAFTSMLYWWCAGNRMEVERIFAESGLNREKWRDRQDYRDGLWNIVDTGDHYMPENLKPTLDLPPLFALERQIDEVYKFVDQAEHERISCENIRYDTSRVVLDITIKLKSGDTRLIPGVLFSDYFCIILGTETEKGIPPISNWKRDVSGKLADPSYKSYWRVLNNAAVAVLGYSTGSWADSGLNRWAQKAQQLEDALADMEDALTDIEL